MTAWDRKLLGQCEVCQGVAWLEGPEGGASQMFQCANCGAEYVLHPGRRMRVGAPEAGKE